MTSIIKVDQIQTAAGTSVMSFDSSGNVVQQQPVIGFQVNRGAAYYDHSNNTIVQYNAVDSNGGLNINGCWDTSTYKFTAPRNGTYQFYAQAMIGGTDEYTRSANMNLVINGSAINSLFVGRNHAAAPQSGSYLRVSGTWLVQLNGNDLVNFNMGWETDGTIDAVEAIHYHGTYAYGYLIG
jgi:hypothetical protein